MDALANIWHLFPDLSDTQRIQISKLEGLYAHWNEQINVISRKDFPYFYSRHVLHSLMLGHYFPLDDSRVMDVGTGGGFPGLPLAIVFPEAQFKLVDSIGKKLKVIDAVCEHLSIKNVTTEHSRMEELTGTYDYVTGRAVKSLPVVFNWTKHLIAWNKGPQKSGMLYLKGGEFMDELKSIPRKVDLYDLRETISADDFYATKKLVHIYQTKSGAKS